ncbi:hypothetical protein [Aurantiacibacter marinus]|uniref:Secreted protein n=1 Tax=Aurantiacibacter marinus TaxID=874156 RepID=A0A0H0XRH3_9SPHN|nr:hypothetical protein [Aurantiacibacter marinus]KLI64601.1 hypothetical protein AAV99_03320 [Aurantiacibacter marinus]
MITERGARAALLLALCSTLPACGDGMAADPVPPITQDEEQAISEAAEMLDERITAPDAEPAEPAAQDSIE